MLCNCCFSQVINFDLGTSSIEGKVYIKNYLKKEYYKNTNVEDSTTIKNGKFGFKLKGGSKHPLPYYLTFSNGVESSQFYVNEENSNFSIDSLYFRFEPKMKGTSVLQKEVLAFDASINEIRSDFRKVHDSLRKTSQDQKNSQEQGDFRIKLREKYSNDYNRIFLSFVKDNPNSFYCFWGLVFGVVGNGYDKESENIFNSFSDKIKSSDVGKIFYKDLLEAKRVSINSKFEPLKLKNEKLQEEILDATRIKGKYVLIDFWFSHCAPCISQFPSLKDIYKKFSGKGFEIIGVSTDITKDVNDWKSVIKKYNLTWKHLIDLDRKEAEILSINKFPTSFLVDENGYIIAKDIAMIDLAKFLENNLKE